MTIRSFAGLEPQLGARVYVDAAATVIGAAEFGDDCSVWPGAVVRADMQPIKIGARVSIQDNAVLHITHASTFNPDGYVLTIGDDVTLAHQAMLHGCTLGSRILVGMQAIIMDGATVADDCIIAAGTLVPQGTRLAGGFLYMGRPAKAVRPLTDQEYELIPYLAQNYMKLKDRYLAETAVG